MLLKMRPSEVRVLRMDAFKYGNFGKNMIIYTPMVILENAGIEAELVNEQVQMAEYFL